jgi:integrator complex subunit 11
LGAAMFLIEYRGIKVVYTGDFNSNADRHLGAAWIDKVKPDILITETTYADTLRDSKRFEILNFAQIFRTRERDFLKQVQECIDGGGKCLIPVFALGRAQVPNTLIFNKRNFVFCWRLIGVEQSLLFQYILLLE